MRAISMLGAVAIALTVQSCGQDTTKKETTKTDSINKVMAGANAFTEHYIPKEEANKMIGSYLASISKDTTAGDTDLNSLILDGDALRDYLSNPEIKHLKVMFAHTLEFIQNGHEGQNAGYHSNALTIVVAGYNQDGNYIYANGSSVMDHAVPCPNNCPTVGTASNSLLQ